MVTENSDDEGVTSTDGECHEQIMTLFDDINTTVNVIKNSLINAQSEFKKVKTPTAQGLSILEVRNQMLCSYLTNLVYLMLRKCQGKTIIGDFAIDHLVEIRTVLERIKPIESKLKYQIDKLIKTAVTGVIKKDDPTQFRADPNNMVDQVSGSDNDSDAEGGSRQEVSESDKAKSGIYVPPKLVAVHYDEDDTAASRREKLMERARRRALNSSVMQELGEEYLETPTEVTEATSYRQKQSRAEKEREDYEETYFVRIPTSKKEMQMKRILSHGNIDGITHFDDISALNPSEDYNPVKKRKRSSKHGAGKKKGFKKKKKRFH